MEKLYRSKTFLKMANGYPCLRSKAYCYGRGSKLWKNCTGQYELKLSSGLYAIL